MRRGGVRSGRYGEARQGGSYVATVTFDVHDEELGGSVYADIEEDLAAQGLHVTLPRELTDSGQPEQMPRNTYVGVFDGPSAKKVREDVLGAAVSAFKSRGLHGSILAVVGGPEHSAGTYTGS